MTLVEEPAGAARARGAGRRSASSRWRWRPCATPRWPRRVGRPRRRQGRRRRRHRGDAQALGDAHVLGKVVIGEGEKDDAPMLYNGEKVGEGDQVELRHRRRPRRGHRPLRRRPGRRADDDRVRRRRRAVVAGPGALHGQARRRGRSARRDRPARRARARRSSASPPRSASARATWSSSSSTSPATSSSSPACGRCGARVQTPTAGDVAGALLAALPGTGVDLLMGCGGRPRASWPPAPSSASAAACRPASRHSASPSARRSPRPGSRRPRSSRSTTSSRGNAMFAATAITGGTLGLSARGAPAAGPHAFADRAPGSVRRIVESRPVTDQE